MAEYKKIVLLEGLENMGDYQFRTVKSLLRKELKLTKKLQEDYDRIQLADWMEDKFPKEAGLDKLIKVCEHIKDLKDLAKKLKTKKAKVQKKKKGKCRTAMKKRRQDELSSSKSLFINKESNKSVPSSKKKRKQITKTEGGKKKKLTQEQAQLPETSGTNIKKDEDCLQNPHKSPPTPPSSSSNKNNPVVASFLLVSQASTSGAETREQDILRHKQRPSRKGGFKTTFRGRIKKKRKQITKTEGGKKKLTQEQAQLPETSGTNIKKDEDCLQNPHKSPPTPPSSSSNKKQKNRTIRKHSISKTEGPQEKQQRVELSSTSNFQAVSELLTFEGLSAIPSSRLQSSQKPLEAHLDLKMSPIFPTSPCHNLPVSLSSDSNVHLNSNAHSILFSGAQVPHVQSATGFSNVGVPLMPSETVFSSSSAPQISQITVPNSIRDLYLLKPATFNSTEAPHKQAIASRNGQTTRAPSAKLTSKSQFLKLHPPATASSNSQVPHILATMPRSISVTQVPQTRTSSSIQTLNSATVKASKNVQAPQVSLPIRPNYFLASVAPPSATPNRLTSHGPLLSIATSRAQTTQIEPGTESICVQALHAPPSTVSRSKCTTPLTQGAESSTGEVLPLPKIKACTIFQAPRVSSPTASSGIMKPHATSSKTSSSLLDQHATSSTASSSSLLALKLSPVTASRTLSAIPGLSETIHRSPSRAPRRGTVPKEPSREEGRHEGRKQVMVLKVTEPFTYDFEETKRMFHATVATETEFFRVKVFDTALMSKFIPGKIIAISHYIGCNGFLEIYRASCVSDVNINPTMIISNTLSESAIATPKISYLLSQAKGTFVNGEFVVFKKSERHECICYGIGDDTGKMAVVVYGRLTNVRCEPGSKLRLVCFELTSTKDVCLLRSVRHSYMQVINEGKPLNPDSVRRNSLEPYF